MKLYNQLAKYVDMLYGVTQDYEKQIKFILQIFKKHKTKPKLIYDVGCGSGRHAESFKKKVLLSELQARPFEICKPVR